MDTVEISEEELYIDMQLEFDEEDEVYMIEYGIKEVSSEDCMILNPAFNYDKLENAWVSYL